MLFWGMDSETGVNWLLRDALKRCGVELLANVQMPVASNRPSEDPKKALTMGVAVLHIDLLCNNLGRRPGCAPGGAPTSSLLRHRMAGPSLCAPQHVQRGGRPIQAIAALGPPIGSRCDYVDQTFNRQ
ncbi:hypothetical protein ABIE13_002093 [Ottowia thiooxydans]|uniref:Uncharacterized protein n=1 Tax=Ottowia thiooxydans TaxID=219182 RepID=A0ABV2Q7T3_9BURK